MSSLLARTVRRARCRLRAISGRDIVIPVDLKIRTEYHGNLRAGWSIENESLTSSSVVYSFGVGEDASFDLSVIRKYGCVVYAFDPTPKSVAWVKREVHCGQFHFEASAIADRDGTLKLFFPSDPGFISASLAKSEQMSGDFFSAPCFSLDSIMRRLGHDSIEVLKMDVEGAEYIILPQSLASGALGRVKQLLVEFHHWMAPFTLQHTKDTLNLLRNAGFRVAWVSPGGHEVLFVRLLNCDGRAAGT